MTREGEAVRRLRTGTYLFPPSEEIEERIFTFLQVTGQQSSPMTPRKEVSQCRKWVWTGYYLDISMICEQDLILHFRAMVQHIALVKMIGRCQYIDNC